MPWHFLVNEFSPLLGVPTPRHVFPSLRAQRACKTKLMTIDGTVANRIDTVTVTYRDEPLPLTPESEAVRYLGFWTTPNGNMKAAMDLVFERTMKAKETIQGHPLDPKQAIEVFAAKAVGNFRYLLLP